MGPTCQVHLVLFNLSTCSDKPSFHLEQGAHPGSKKKVTNGRRNEGGDKNDDEMKCDFMAILGYHCNVCIYVKRQWLNNIPSKWSSTSWQCLGIDGDDGGESRGGGSWSTEFDRLAKISRWSCAQDLLWRQNSIILNTCRVRAATLVSDVELVGREAAGSENLVAEGEDEVGVESVTTVQISTNTPL